MNDKSSFLLGNCYDIVLQLIPNDICEQGNYKNVLSNCNYNICVYITADNFGYIQVSPFLVKGRLNIFLLNDETSIVSNDFLYLQPNFT